MGLLTKSSESYRSAPLGWPRQSESLCPCLFYRIQVLGYSGIITFCSDLFGSSPWSFLHQYWSAFPYYVKKSHLHFVIHLIGRMADQIVTTTFDKVVLVGSLSSRIGWLSQANHQECCLSVPHLRPSMSGLWLPASSLILITTSSQI